MRAVLFAAIAAAGLAACGGNAAHVVPSTPSITASASATPVATATPDLSATVVPSLAEYLQPLTDFKSKYGDPPQSTQGRIRIPRIGVDAAIDERVVGPDLDLGNLNPYGPTDVTWYNFTIDARFGGEPGAGENAIFSGHVDYDYAVHYAQEAHYRGAGVFAGIEMLNTNDAIEITMNGVTTRYGVVWKKQVPQASAEWGSIFAASVTEGDAITLITCSGDFNPATLEYNQRTVVRARRY